MHLLVSNEGFSPVLPCCRGSYRASLHHRASVSWDVKDRYIVGLEDEKHQEERKEGVDQQNEGKVELNTSFLLVELTV